MAAQKFEVGQSVEVRWLNINTKGVIRSYDARANGYYVYLPLNQEEIYYTSRELDAWN
jgi:hypothetical protein